MRTVKKGHGDRFTGALCIYCTRFFIVCEQFYKLILGTLESQKS